ncbi:MAG: hypothetical protein ACRYGG_06160, partial [Janthinobacterium lividum]
MAKKAVHNLDDGPVKVFKDIGSEYRNTRCQPLLFSKAALDDTQPFWISQDSPRSVHLIDTSGNSFSLANTGSPHC